MLSLVFALEACLGSSIEMVARRKFFDCRRNDLVVDLSRCVIGANALF